MKTTLFILINLFFLPRCLAQDLNYDNYHVVFCDEFEYTSIPSGTVTTATVGLSAGTTFSHTWDINNIYGFGVDGGSTCNYIATQTTMPSSGVLRLTANADPDSTLPGHRSRQSGILNSVVKFDSYGILEARIKFPSRPTPDSNYSRAQVCFWTFLANQKNEIDVIDLAMTDGWRPLRVIDWYYTNYKGFSDWYPVTHDITHEDIFAPSGIFPTHSISDMDLAQNFHTYSALITPENVTYYIDGFFLATIHYRQVRIYPQQHYLQLVLAAGKLVEDGQFLEVDWIKLWKKNCSTDSVNVADSTVALDYIVPHLYKHRKIVVSSPSILTKSTPDIATILEAEQTTLLSNLTIDESTLDTSPYDLETTKLAINDFNYAVINPYNGVYRNGFFEIRPLVCGADDISWYRGSDTVNETVHANIFNSQLTAETIKNEIKNDTPLSIPIAVRDKNIQVYPNPANDKLNISCYCESKENINITIKDASGRVRYNATSYCSGEKNIDYNIDISSFIPGIYSVELTMDKGHIVKKIVKL